MKFNIFIDESGMSNPKIYKASPYFTLCGVVVNEDSRSKLEVEFNKLKEKHLKKNFVIHMSELKKELGTDTKIINFANDLEKILPKIAFFLLYTIVDNKKANERSWNSTAVYRKTYRIIVGNLVKFLIAKDAYGKIYSEASNSAQDIVLYQNLFHYLANGIPELGILSKDVRKHLTSLSFVTKLNNDIEEQMADLFGCIGRISLEIKNGIRKIESLNPIEKVLYESAQKNIFDNTRGRSAAKIKFYRAIDSFALLP